jgi:protein-S-isoprenylcysteine O-methyltransferase Ste14
MDTLHSPTLVTVIFWTTVCSWIGVSFWEGRGHQAKYTTLKGKRSDLLCFWGVGVAGLLALVGKGFFPDVNLYAGATLFWVGVALVWIGMGLRHTAVVTLGTYHVMTIYTQPQQPVITAGPYKYIRHPSYLGVLIAILGIAVTINSLPGSTILAGITVLVLVQRIHIEDRYLIRRLGVGYKRYAEDTYRLVPFVW